MSKQWAAGFFDGEGTVGFWHCPPRKNSKVMKLRASISQNIKSPLIKFKRTVGFGRIYGPYKSSNGPNYHYKLEFNGIQVIELHKKLKKYLEVKNTQFERAIKEYKKYDARLGKFTGLRKKS